MVKNSTLALVERKEFPRFKAEILSIGKNKKDPSSSEDRWLVTENTFAVIDGSGKRAPVKFGGKSGGQFAADVVKNRLETTNISVNGRDLVILITSKLNEEINKLGLRKVIEQIPEARPAALFTAARIVGDKLIITALGDVGCRINGKLIHTESFKTEEMMTKKRIQAMKNARSQNPNIKDEELIDIGRKAFEDDLKIQARDYFNSLNSELGLGIIDGRVVPNKFIKVYELNLKEVRIIEIFSDGYFKLVDVPEIASWEQAHQEVEKEDFLKWDKYPSVKWSSKDHFSDDRTILIVKILNER